MYRLSYEGRGNTVPLLRIYMWGGRSLRGTFVEKEYIISSKQKKLVKKAKAILKDIFEDGTADPQIARYNIEGLIEFAENILGHN